jgi:hypothetical protein
VGKLNIIVLLWYFEQLISIAIGTQGFVLLLSFFVLLLQKKSVNIIAAICALTISLGIASYTLFFTPCNVGKFEPASLILLVVLIYLVFTLNVDSFLEQIYKSKKIFMLIFFISIADFALSNSLLGLLIPPLQKHTLASIYLEPSHAIAYSLPFILMVSARYSKLSRPLIIPNIFLLLNMSSSSAALLILANLKHYLFAILILIIAAIFVNFSSQIQDLISTINKNSNEIILLALNAPEIYENLTILVYLSGWSRIFEIFANEIYFGEGFNMMGCSGFIDQYQNKIFTLAHGYLNVEDGSFLFAKIMSEFGFASIAFGVILIILLLIYVIKNFLISKPDKYWFVVVVMVLFVMFLRNPGGYFSLPALLALASLFKIIRNFKLHIQKRYFKNG